MLTPEYLSRITEQSEEYAAELRAHIVQQIIRRMMARIGRGEAYMLTASDKWQIDILQDAGLLLTDIQKELAKYAKIQEKELKKAMEDAGVVSLKSDDAIYESVGLHPTPLKQSPHLIRLMERNYKATNAELLNFTRTTAFESQRLYIKACDTAYRLVTSGAMTYSAAVQQALSEAISGGGTVRYPSGHVDTLETAVTRSIRTGINQATGDIQLRRMEEMDWDIIGTTAHLGARTGDGGTNHTNHFWWQGLFFTRTGRTPGLPNFKETTGYGKVDGICGANCRHGFFPGNGKNNFYEKFRTMDNEKAEKLQRRQRELERRVRSSKRELIGLKEAIDKCVDNKVKFELQQKYDRKSELLRYRNEEYKDFCKANNLKPLNDRLKVLKWNREEAYDANTAAGRYKASVTSAQKSKFTKCIEEFNMGQKDIIKIPNIEKELSKSIVGKETIQYLSDDPCNIRLYYKVDVAKTDLGYYDSQYDEIGIFASNTKTIRMTAKTLIHEATHRKYKIGGDLHSECVCRAKEVMHENQTNTLTGKQIRDIIKSVKESYPEFKNTWRRQ